MLVVVYAAWQLSLEASHDRTWLEHYERTPNAVVEADVVRLYNVRNWNHDHARVLSREWLDEVVIDPTDIARVWFVLATFSDSDYVGHSFLSFELADGQAYTFSIEARREEGEVYGTIAGLMNTFELWYGWGTERDFLSASLILLGRPLEMYPLELTAAERAAVFRSVAGATAQVAAQPEFYDTFSVNCTNLLAKAINEQSPGTIPYDLAWNLPGLAPAFLARERYIDIPDDTKDMRSHFKITTASPALLDSLKQGPLLFSQVLRTELAKPHLVD